MGLARLAFSSSARHFYSNEEVAFGGLAVGRAACVAHCTGPRNVVPSLRRRRKSGSTGTAVVERSTASEEGSLEVALTRALVANSNVNGTTSLQLG